MIGELLRLNSQNMSTNYAIENTQAIDGTRYRRLFNLIFIDNYVAFR